MLRMILREIGNLVRFAEPRVTTAELLYRLPDHPSVLQSFVWQKLDHAPGFPELHRFIGFWQREIEGPLHSVRFTHRKLIGPGEWRNVVGEFRLH